MIMESLDDEIGLRHYQSRLLSSTFGSWVTWLLSEKANTAQNMATATSFSSHRQLATVLFRLQSNVNVANETQYRLFLGLTMSRFLQKRRGLHSLGHFVCRSKVVRDEDHHYRIDDFTWNHSRMIQLYKRLRNRAFRRMQLTSAANDALRIPSSRRARWGGQAMQQWVTVTVKSIQDRILMRKAAVKSKNAARLKYMRKWLLCCCQRREDRKLESDCNEVYYYVHLCRRVLRRFVCLVQDRRTRLQMVAAAQHMNRRHIYQKGLRHLWQCAQERRRNRHEHISLAAYSKGKAMRRVFVQLVRLLKIRYTEKGPVDSLVSVHLLHMWGFRRKSQALLQWQCQFQRCRLEHRRRKIAAFYYRYRILKSSFCTLSKTISHLRSQRNKRLIGECAVYRKSALLGMRAFQKRQLLSRICTINNYKAMLCWKYFRSIRGLQKLRSYANMRREKRRMLREAHVNYAQSYRKAACVEFLHVALDAPATTPAEHARRADKHLLAHVFGVWKGVIRHSPGASAGAGGAAAVGCYTARPNGSQVGSDALTAQRRSSLASLAAGDGPAITSTSSAVVTATKYQEMAFPKVPSTLSRAKPRCSIPEAVALPVSHREAALDSKYLPYYTAASSTTSAGWEEGRGVATTAVVGEEEEASLSRWGTSSESLRQLNRRLESLQGVTSGHPYGYLAASTALPRPSHMPTLSSAAPAPAPALRWQQQHAPVGTAYDPAYAPAYLYSSSAYPPAPEMGSEKEKDMFTAMPKPSTAVLSSAHPTSSSFSSSLLFSPRALPSPLISAPDGAPAAAGSADSSGHSSGKLQDPVTVELVRDILHTLRDCKQLLF